MAEVQLASSLEIQKWTMQYWQEYVRKSSFEPYTGKSPTSIFQVKSELLNEAGKYINIPLITRLRGAGVTGASVLDGNEEDIGNYNCQLSVDWLRNAVRVPKSTSYKTNIDFMNAGRPLLNDWSAGQLRDALIDALGQIVVKGSAGATDTVVSYASASSSQLNAYLVNNSDRVLFGAATTNNASNNWANSLANIDATADKLSAAIGSLARRQARLAGGLKTSTNITKPHIRPFKLTDGREYYVMFCSPYAFRDLKTDTNMINANRDARPRDVNANPLFQDGDLIYDGVIYHEVPELDELTISGAGASSIDVAQNFLCGSQACAIGYGQMPKFVIDNLKDFQFRPGVAIEELRGQRKMSLNGIQAGIYSVLTAGVAD